MLRGDFRFVADQRRKAALQVWTIVFDRREAIFVSLDFRLPELRIAAMKQLAAIMMFAACLIYGAMPAMAVMPMGGQPGHAMPERPVVEHSAMAGHSGHGKAASEAVQPDHAHGGTQQPCPHAGKGGNTICVAPFCSACLVVLPHITFVDPGRFIHRYPAPETGPSLTVSGTEPLTPPPRA